MKRQYLLHVIALLAIYASPSLVKAALQPSEFEKYCSPITSAENRIFIRDSLPASIYLFKDAVTQPNTTVCLLEVRLDFSNADMDFPIKVANNVKILGTRTANNSGSSLFSKNRDYSRRIGDNIIYYKDLLELDGDNITINGLGIFGGNYTPSKNHSNGIVINSKIGINIGNVEMAGWGTAAISIRDNMGDRLNKENPESGVYIHDSFLHHNQNTSLGYGIVLHDSAYALIEHNVFDFNRHAIAGDGSEGSGYYAYRNLILKGGGDNGLNHTHQLDMHGTDSGILHRGGDAGEYMEIGENSMQYKEGVGFFLRGKPAIQSYLYKNFFAHPVLIDKVLSRDGAIKYYYSNTTRRYENTIKYDTYGYYSVCDIDGDGKDDLVQPAGASWWYSGQGKYPWTFLERSYTTLAEVTTFTDFNQDGYCDVVRLDPYSVIEASGFSKDTSAYKAVIYSPLKKETLNFDDLYFNNKNLSIGDFDGDGFNDFFTTADNTWLMYSTQTKAWHTLNTSSYPLANLAFGDFNGDKKTDVLGISDSKNGWVVSWSGTSAWQKINSKLSSKIKSFKITDVNGDGKDDVVLVEAKLVSSSNPAQGYYIYTNISLSGQTNWIKKRHHMPYKNGWEGSQPLKYFIGKFDNQAGADLLVVDTLRNGYLSSSFNTNLQKHSVEFFNY